MATPSYTIVRNNDYYLELDLAADNYTRRLSDRMFNSMVQRTPYSHSTDRSKEKGRDPGHTRLRDSNYRKQVRPGVWRVGNSSDHAEVVHQGRDPIESTGGPMVWDQAGGGIQTRLDRPYPRDPNASFQGVVGTYKVKGVPPNPWIFRAYNFARDVSWLRNKTPEIPLP